MEAEIEKEPFFAAWTNQPVVVEGDTLATAHTDTPSVNLLLDRDNTGSVTKKITLSLAGCPVHNGSGTRRIDVKDANQMTRMSLNLAHGKRTAQSSRSTTPPAGRFFPSTPTSRPSPKGATRSISFASRSDQALSEGFEHYQEIALFKYLLSSDIEHFASFCPQKSTSSTWFLPSYTWLSADNKKKNDRNPAMKGSFVAGFRRAHARAALTVVKRAMAFTFIHTDHLGTARMVTDMDGKIVSTHDYNAYGEERTEELLEHNSHKFTGHERDIETGLDYMMARMYSSNVPRFLQTDPGYDYKMEDPMSWNLYSYCGNNPIMRVDPTGKWITPWEVMDYASYQMSSKQWVNSLNRAIDNPTLSNIGSAALDFVGAGLDGTALLLPGVPGGYGLGVKALTDADNAISGARALGNAAEISADAIHGHHLLPKQFVNIFSKAGLDIENFKLSIPKDLHTTKPNGVHTNLGGNWNKQWNEFFTPFMKKGTLPNKQEIMQQLKKMIDSNEALKSALEKDPQLKKLRLEELKLRCQQ
ncbi:MAG: DUF2380 domain-containing protein [Rhodopseudomonas palustris]|nr:DUF2380 domain-containing protein [Rhodopseudomonas palustris]